MSPTETVLAKADALMTQAETRWIDWLRIPSIGADPTKVEDCRRAAQFVVDQLVAMGFSGGLRETGGHPAIVMHHAGPGAGPAHRHAAARDGLYRRRHRPPARRPHRHGS